MKFVGVDMEYTIVGEIINTHGINGELKIYPLTDDPERFSDFDELYIGELKMLVNIRNVRYHKGFPIIRLYKFDNINEVLQFKGQYIYIDDRDKIVLPENRYFISDLIDCEVFDMNKKKVGYIKDILQNSGNDVYIVKNDINNKEYLIPAVQTFIKKVDIDKKMIFIDPIEGMIE